MTWISMPSFMSVAYSAVAVTAFALFLGGPPGSRNPAPVPVAAPAVRSDWPVPDVDRLPQDAMGAAVRYGRDLVARTYALIGPEVADASLRFAGNNLACQNCHLDAGSKRFGIPFQGVYDQFPNYRARSGAVGPIEDRVQGCMTRSMNGRALPADGREMGAMVAYLKFMSSVAGVPAGRGAGAMPELDRAADPGRGKVVYEQTCLVCHGANGLGQRAGVVGDAKGYTFPPLWGADSFNDGAGMNRLIAAANFVHSNMPNGATWRTPVLQPGDAWDVAAYMQAQARPRKAGLEDDFPEPLQKPVDTGYGPYADGFSQAQHRLGPFGPIRARVEELERGQVAK